MKDYLIIKKNMPFTGRVYQIVCDCGCNQKYVGSTKQTLSQRMTKHRHDANRVLSPLYLHMREVGTEKFRIIRLELIENCLDKEQLRAREQYWIGQFDTLKNGLNGRYAIKDPNRDKECQRRYREANTDKIKERVKKYRQANTDKIKEQTKKYRHANKDVLKQKWAGYYQANKDVLNEKTRQYHRANRERYKEQVECECGAILTHHNLSLHKKTNKHQQYETLKDFIYS